MSDELQLKYEQMRKQRGPDYRPRTHHLDAAGRARFTNRLFLETSPYLLQHAHNPVDWYPWGPEAFEKARAENLPIMVSIGYATCHWCHVMEAESFEDEEIARVINDHFVPIKIDREERPDVDAIYMQAVQALGIGGGWPLNVWLTPDLKPFFGGTYFPARDGDRPGATGFLTVLRALKKFYDENPGKVDETARAITTHLAAVHKAAPSGGLPDENILHRAIEVSRKIYDPVNGGVQGAPKFPSSLPVRLLLRYHRRTQDETVLQMATHTLEKMAAGGMYDHVAGGFHRYATDAGWLVPHFEKMLYDNALLVPAYLEGYQVTGKPRFKEVVEQVLDYVLREMRSPEGLFYSATDADSIGPSGEPDEGYYFTWTPDEVRALLDDDTAGAVMAYYALSERGNFEGRNILHTPQLPGKVAQDLGLTETDLRKKIEKARKILREARNERNLPLRDEKVLAAWNGLMISALARAGFVLDRSDYTAAAAKAAHSILENLVCDGKLHRSRTDGRLGSPGFLEDHAFVTAACIDLYEATSDIAWLLKAREFDALTAAQFADETGGGFFTSRVNQSDLIVREKSAQDNALPSGNSVAAMNLLRLGNYTGEPDYTRRAEALLKAFSSSLRQNPVAFAEMLQAVETYLDGPVEIVVSVGPGGKTAPADLVAPLRETYLPNRLIFIGAAAAIAQSAGELPFLQEKETDEDQAAVYICDRNGCYKPASSGKSVQARITRAAEFKQPV